MTRHVGTCDSAKIVARSGVGDCAGWQVYHNLMARVAPAIPEETALLCEKCGYIVNGIPQDSLCPECAAPIVESLPAARRPPDWEREKAGFLSFWKTTAQLIFVPGRFFRSMTPRGEVRRSANFARWHIWLTSFLFGAAAYIHASWAWPIFRNKQALWVDRPYWEMLVGSMIIAIFAMVAYVLLSVTTAIASRLTAWEAAYRGLRLPRRVVQRALHYHSAHYLPVALLTLGTIWGYQVLIYKIPNIDQYAVRYLYVLCAEVIIAAAYLFITYWKGMRNLMYANG